VESNKSVEAPEIGESRTQKSQITGSFFSSLKSWLIKKLIQLVVIFTILAGLYFYLRSNEKYAVFVNFFEHTNPKISVVQRPVGVGSNTSKLVLELEDLGTGLDEVIVRSDQEGEVRELIHKRYPEPKFKDLLSIDVTGKALELSEGSVDIVVSVFDRSFWSNGLKEEIPLKVDYDKPKLEVLSAQHNAVIGGTELCFYRVTQSQGGSSGVRVGDIEFEGYPARFLDPAFEAAPDVYFSYFAIPLQFQASKDQVKVFARNGVGNETTQGFYYKAQSVRASRRFREIDQLFVETKLQELTENLQQIQENNGEESVNQSDLKQRFDYVLNRLRVLAERQIRKTLKTVELKSSWERSFLRPKGATLKVDFGDVRDYVLDGNKLGSIIYTGAEHAAPQYLPIFAAAPGKVRLVDNLPYYGQTVIIDHGFGISTLYSSLSKTSVKVDDEVATTTELGQAGVSGVSDSPGMLYELRVHSIPVRPIEWWDQNWVHDHIKKKIEDMKRSLNLITEGNGVDQTPELSEFGLKSDSGKTDSETSGPELLE